MSFVWVPLAHSEITPVSPDNVLILYDSDYEWEWTGYLDGVFLANLIGHFDGKTYQLMPIKNYTPGLLERFAVTFYLGSHYNAPLPKAFITDVMHTTRTIVWFRYNLWQLMDANPNFTSHYGFVFNEMDLSGYDHVIYKKTSLNKDLADNELGRVSITNSALAITPATAKKTSTGNTIPYIVHSKNFWYIADIPFSYLTENDRYLAFADLLYDILDVKSVEKKRAILRLEDVDPTYDLALLRTIADYLYSQHVPFAISVIPYYQDPLGYYNEGVPKFIKLTDAPEFIATLKYMESKGGTIILHGYTHQYSNIPNGFTGVSGHDYEFFRVANDPETFVTTLFEPLMEDSPTWVADRVTSALDLLKEAHLSASIWETPHYAASKVDNQYFAQTFPANIGRILYFDSSDEKHYAEQFYPYIIQKDAYGQKILPENLGCISPSGWLNFPGRSVSDVITTARKNLVVRDAWASMYFHPYIGLSSLQEVIPAIKAMGYEFVVVSPHLK